MARAVSTRRKLFFTALSWTIAFLIFFPVLWTVLTSFKTEGEAVSIPPTVTSALAKPSEPLGVKRQSASCASAARRACRLRSAR